MTINISFNDQTHQISEFPPSLDGFFAVVSSLFGEKLPKTWTLKYSDHKGDNIRVLHEQDFNELIQLESQTSGAVIELFIISSDFPVQNSEIIQQEQENSEEILNKNYEENKTVENDKKTRKSDSKEREKEFDQAKKLLKKILKGKLSEPEITEATQQLELIKSHFTPEQKEKFEAKKEHLESKIKFMNKLTEAKNNKTKENYSAKYAKFGKLRIVLKRIQQQSPENAPIIFMTVKIFIKLFKAMRKGKTGKIEQYQLQLLSFLPDENPTTFEELFASIPKDLPKGELKERLYGIAKLYYKEFCPENNNIFEELEQIRKAKKEKKERRLKHSRANFE